MNGITVIWDALVITDPAILYVPTQYCMICLLIDIAISDYLNVNTTETKKN
jgi:hypothetical protein